MKVPLQKHSIKDTGGRSHKKYKDSPKGMHEEVDNTVKRYAEAVAYELFSPTRDAA